MKSVKTRAAAAATVLGLGGLTGLALSSGGKAPPPSVAAKPRVRTEVIRHTTHVTRHAGPGPAALAAAAPGPVAAPPPEAVTASAVTPAEAPVVTASSGTAAGAGAEGYGDDDYGEASEREIEVADD